MSHNAPRLAAAAPATLFVAAVLIVLGSCATPLRVESTVDPLALLDSGAAAYVRLSGASARDLAPDMAAWLQAALAKAQKGGDVNAKAPAAFTTKSLKGVLDRTRLVGLAIWAPGGAPLDGTTAAKGTASPTAEAGIRLPSFQACLLGDFPFRAASFSLATDGAWKREGSGFYNKDSGLRIAVPGPELALASNGKLESLLAAAKSPASSPVPERLASLASRDIIIWAPEPMKRLTPGLAEAGIDIPIRGVMLAASPQPGADPKAGAGKVEAYDASIAFLMEDAQSARLFRPALKLAWYALSTQLFPASESARGANFSLDGELYQASGIRLTRADILGLVSSLGGSLASGGLGL
jgi:hypothetical protein